MNFGTFSGNPKTEWLTDPGGEDRDMRLLEEFSYTGPDGKLWRAPSGSIIDGASIPRPLWATVGSPFTDDYRRAAVVHDVACDAGIERELADKMFYFACRAGGCSEVQARLLYAGVRLGAWSEANLYSWTISNKALIFKGPGVLPAPTPEEQFLPMKFDAIAKELRAIPGEMSVEQLEATIQRHLKFPDSQVP